MEHSESHRDQAGPACRPGPAGALPQKAPAPASRPDDPPPTRQAAAAARRAGKNLWALARMIFVLALFVPLVVFMMYVNYTVDRSGIYQGDQYLRSVAQMLLSGQDITGYEQLNEQQRKILQILVNQFDPVPNTIVLGSSRIMQLDTRLAGLEDGQFFNCALTGADFYDIVGSFYLFDRAGKLPQNLIIGVDPWLFNTGAEATDARSDKELYAEFLTQKLGIPQEYEAEDPNLKWTSLYSPSYFQSNISYLLQSQGDVKRPQPVVGDLYNQLTEVKRYDGSLLYDRAFREQSQDAIDAAALYQTSNFAFVEYYTQVDSDRLEIFQSYLSYVKSLGVNVILILTPYHPIAYDNAAANADHYAGFMATEPAVRRVAAALDIPVYGSYNPHAIAGVSSADFYDGIHCRGECIAKFFPGVPAALENQANGVDVSLDYEITAEEAALRDSEASGDSGTEPV